MTLAQQFIKYKTKAEAFVQVLDATPTAKKVYYYEHLVTKTD